MAEEKTAQIVRFVDGVEIRPAEAHQGVVELLRRALEEAEQGRLRTVAIVKFDRVGCYSTNYDGEEAMTTIIGGVRMLEHDLIRDYVRRSEKDANA